jgi:hypothetical protein
MTANQIAAKAAADFAHAGSVRVTGRMYAQDSQALNLTISGNWCQGSVTEPEGTMRLIVESPDAAWMAASPAFWDNVGHGWQELASAAAAGQWIKVAADGGPRDETDLCTLSMWSDVLTTDAGLFAKDNVVTINGEQAVKLTDISDDSSVYVSESATPALLRFDPAPGSQVSFTEHASKVAIAPPPTQDIDPEYSP